MDVNAQNMELLKALREHGQTVNKTVQHFFTGGLSINPNQSAPAAQPSANANSTVLGGPGTSTANGLSSGFNLINGSSAAAPATQSGTNTAQLNAAYTGAQGGLNQQQQFANATAAGGTGALTSQQALLAALQNQANGVGPNPAQAALNQNTAANVANQAAMAAGQRGAAGNVGLLERQAAQTGAQTQQNAVGQAATLQAQQQLAAEQQLQAQQAQLVAQQQNAVQGVNNTQQNEQNILQGANTSYNNTQAGIQSSINAANASTAAGNQAMTGSIFGGLASGAGLAALAFAAKGGEIQKYAAGGVTAAGPSITQTAAIQGNGPASAAGQWLNSSEQSSSPSIVMPSSSAPSTGQLQNSISSGIGNVATAFAKPSIQTGTPDPFNAPGANTVSENAGNSLPGTSTLMPDADFAKGGPVKNFKPGGKVPGKPKVNRDSYSNDTVPAMVSPGEVVLPLHVTQSADPVNAAAQFMAAIMKRKSMMGKAA